MRVTVTGLERVVRSLERLPDAIREGMSRYAVSNERRWLGLLKGMIDHVVYVDSPRPEVYKRNFNLLKAASSHSSQFKSGASAGVLVELFNDSSLVQPTFPKGGSAAEDVPHEIEEGDYPQPWYGYSLPRPAYQMTADFLRPRIEAEVGAIVDEVIGT